LCSSSPSRAARVVYLLFTFLPFPPPYVLFFFPPPPPQPLLSSPLIDSAFWSTTLFFRPLAETAAASAAAAAAGDAVSLLKANADALLAFLDADHGRPFTVSADPIIHGVAFRASDGCPLGVLTF